MMHSLIVSFISSDRPGIIESVSTVVNRHGGNWLESRMAHMAGKFVGIVRIGIEQPHVNLLRDALLQLNTDTFTLTIDESIPTQSQETFATFSLGILGQDRPGIMQEVSIALAQCQINVIEMNTNITSAPMTAEPLFDAQGIIAVPLTIKETELAELLEKVANTLNVDISLEVKN